MSAGSYSRQGVMSTASYRRQGVMSAAFSPSEAWRRRTKRGTTPVSITQPIFSLVPSVM